MLVEEIYIFDTTTKMNLHKNTCEISSIFNVLIPTCSRHRQDICPTHNFRFKILLTVIPKIFFRMYKMQLL